MSYDPLLRLQGSRSARLPVYVPLRDQGQARRAVCEVHQVKRKRTRVEISLNKETVEWQIR